MITGFVDSATDGLLYFSENGRKYSICKAVTMGKNELNTDICVIFEIVENNNIFVNWFWGASLENNNEIMSIVSTYEKGVAT